LVSIVIPEVEFEELPLREAMDFVRRRSKDLDPKRQGINILLQLDASRPTRLVTMSLENVSLEDLIRYVCMATGVSYRIDPVAVVVMERGRVPDLVETRFYSLASGTPFATGDEQDEEDFMAFFDSKGVTFPEGAHIGYHQRKNKLVVTNTAENLRKVERILTELGMVP
jgi:general secretion pathway protein D